MRVVMLLCVFTMLATMSGCAHFMLSPDAGFTYDEIHEVGGNNACKQAINSASQGHSKPGTASTLQKQVMTGCSPQIYNEEKLVIKI